jgi:hypothetical protein
LLFDYKKRTVPTHPTDYTTNQQRVLDEAKKLQEMTAKLSLQAAVPAVFWHGH